MSKSLTQRKHNEVTPLPIPASERRKIYGKAKTTPSI